MEANEYILASSKEKSTESENNDKDHTPPASGGGASESDDSDEADNQGTLILDATCAPANIRYPQDFSLLNEAREKLETVIIRFCKAYGLARPRMYRRQGRKHYLALAKTKKRSTKKIRFTIRKQLSYVRRDIKYLESFLSEGYAPSKKEIKLLLTIYKLYEQQKYMYKARVHSVADNIVSISQPWLRPIVRGKIKTPVEFGAKLDLSLADQIYRTGDNRGFCKLHGIRLSGPKLGRPGETAKADKKIEYQDNTDRIEVERTFRLSKRCYGLGLIRTKLEETTLTSIALSVFVTNLFKILPRIFFALILMIQSLWNRSADFQAEAI